MECIICGEKDVRPYWDHRLVQCVRCSLIRARDDFFSVDVREVYDDTYFEGAEYVSYTAERRALLTNFRRRLSVLQRLAPAARSLGEVGSGYGYFLELASRTWTAKGFEISPHAVAVAVGNGLDCTNEDYLQQARPPLQADIMCLWDTIEHLKEPHRVLARMHEDLKSGGIVAISTGDVGAMLPRLQKARWRLIHPPSHLWYFSSATLSHLLREVGFEVVDVTYPLFFRSLGNILGVISPRRLPPSISTLPVPLQTGDLMEVYARKV